MSTPNAFSKFNMFSLKMYTLQILLILIFYRTSTRCQRILRILILFNFNLWWANRYFVTIMIYMHKISLAPFSKLCFYSTKGFVKWRSINSFSETIQCKKFSRLICLKEFNIMNWKFSCRYHISSFIMHRFHFCG